MNLYKMTPLERWGYIEYQGQWYIFDLVHNILKKTSTEKASMGLCKYPLSPHQIERFNDLLDLLIISNADEVRYPEYGTKNTTSIRIRNSK